MKTKNTYLLFFLFAYFIFRINIANSQGAWTQKADFGGGFRFGAVGFSIGTKGYIGTASGNTQDDFWEWNQATYVWTQKANFGGPVRYFAIGFSIGTKGYIGTGSNTVIYNDFWEWDQATNTWTQKADFGGTARSGAVGFSIGTKGYIGTGSDTITGYKNDFWEWDQATNSWTQKANFGGTQRRCAVGFSIGTKGYIGTGGDTLTGYQTISGNGIKQQTHGCRKQILEEWLGTMQLAFPLAPKDILELELIVLRIFTQIFGNIVILV